VTADLNRLLFVDDDQTLLPFVTAYLEENQFKVDTAATASEMENQLEARHYDAILLDLSLPDEDGLVLLRKLSHCPTPVMILSNRNDEDTRLAALELGARDFLTKPCSPKELLIRLKNLVPQIQAAPELRQPCSSRYTFSGWTLDLAARSLTASDDSPTVLTRGEFNLLAALVVAHGEVVPRNQLLDVCSRSDQEPTSDTVTTLIYRLRKKLKNNKLIVTLPGLGYRISAEINQI